MDKETRTWAMLLHFSLLAGFVVPFAGLIAPIVIWQLKKEQMPEIDAHGKMVLNFIISMLIYSAVCFLLAFVLIGIVLGVGVFIMGIVFPIVGGIKANSGELWNYPLTLKLIS